MTLQHCIQQADEKTECAFFFAAGQGLSDAGLEALLVMSSNKSIWTLQLPVVPPIESLRLVLHSMGDVRSLEIGHIAWT